MNRVTLFFAFWSVVGTLSAAEVQLNGHKFTLPEGFQIRLVGTAPVVNRPITADFDDGGRLYVTDSSGSNDKVQVQVETRPHRILRLEDVDGDGVFDRHVVFADKMSFPEGTMWYDGSLYVAAPPSIWKLTDKDGDGVAEERSEWYQGKTLTGCANDLHGPYLGIDGWIYWCKGAFAEQTHQVHGREWKTKASHIFRTRPDGTGIEPVMTGGMDNPVDVVLLPNGDRVLSNTFIVHPGNGLRDGLLHTIYGGVYGKDHGVLEGHPRTGELMPILSHMGPAAACGLVRYDAAVFGRDFQDNLFCCQFNKHLISRHVLSPSGSSYTSTDSDFLLSDNTDFHPTDILQDADGSLLVVDTGGWYKLCCPSSQLHKPDILGGIYRIERTGAQRLTDPRGLKIAWSQVERNEAALTKLAADERPVVRQRAQELLARQRLARPEWQQGKVGTVEPVALKIPQGTERSAAVRAAQHDLWAWNRVAREQGLPRVRGHLAASIPAEVRQVALHLVSLYRDAESAPQVTPLLKVDSGPNRRLAAEVLGRLGDKRAVPELLAAARFTALPASSGSGDARPAERVDRALEHAIIFALIEIGDAAGTAGGLASDHPRVQRAALIALDQMPGGKLGADQVLARLDSPEPLLRETANWLVSRHPEWGGELAGWFQKQLQGEATGPAADQLRELLTRHARHPAIQELLAKTVSSSAPLATRELAIQVMAQAAPAEMPTVWAETLAKVMTDESGKLVSEAVLAAQAIPPGKQPHAGLQAALQKLAANPQAEPTARLPAMAAVAGGLKEVSTEQFTFLLARLTPERSVGDRSAAADALAKAKLEAIQLTQLAELLKTVGPLELDRLLAPFERSTDEKVGLQLLDALQKASSLSSLRIDSLQQKLTKYPPTVQQEIGKVVSLVNVDAAAQRKQIEERLPLLASGDVRRGQAVFNSAKAACTACHKFGYLGGTAGPDLTRIGGIRVERDLLEAILFPSLSFVRSYEPVVVVTADGRIINGLIRNETSSELTLTTGPNQEVKIARADVEEIRPSTVSVMPAGLDKQLTPQELADLVAFLKNAK